MAAGNRRLASKAMVPSTHTAKTVGGQNLSKLIARANGYEPVNAPSPDGRPVCPVPMTSQSTARNPVPATRANSARTTRPRRTSRTAVPSAHSPPTMTAGTNSPKATTAASGPCGVLHQRRTGSYGSSAATRPAASASPLSKNLWPHTVRLYRGILANLLGFPRDSRAVDDGWGARIRTWEWRIQSPLPYHLATPQIGSAQV